MPTLAQAISSSEPLRQAAPVLFYAFAGLACLSAWAVVVSQNIIRMSVFLMLTLGAVAGLYFMLNAEFLAAIQLIVYAGGTLILIVFGIMLTSKNPFAKLQVATWEFVVGSLVAVVIGALLVFAMVNSPITVQSQAGTTAGYDQVQAIGRSLLTRFLVPFEVAAVLLLVVMIGAAFMARRRVALAENESGSASAEG